MDFHFRVDEHLRKKLAEIDNSAGINKNEKKVLALEMAIQTFLAGLFPQIAIYLRQAEYVDFQATAKAASDTEKTLESMSNINNKFKTLNNTDCHATQNNLTTDLTNNSQNNNQNAHTNPNRTNKYCDFCKRNNHNGENCRYLKNEKSKNNGNNNKNYNRNNNKNNTDSNGNYHKNNNNNVNQAQCNYCKNFGHVEKACRKRSFDLGR
ncbi:putative uncharacterized protein DDB_G0283051 [Cotesia glomerata]|uniref:putative uncharacterized protein DDB_G0283051 n=1 Tax=Cotesia glomerata TaxID=32391 RepID=UPI001D017DD9|nr:putative uncharacterized protein DDB_G0283051 [Cotesia glomerata]